MAENDISIQYDNFEVRDITSINRGFKGNIWPKDSDFRNQRNAPYHAIPYKAIADDLPAGYVFFIKDDENKRLILTNLAANHKLGEKQYRAILKGLLEHVASQELLPNKRPPQEQIIFEVDARNTELLVILADLKYEAVASIKKQGSPDKFVMSFVHPDVSDKRKMELITDTQQGLYHHHYTKFFTSRGNSFTPIITPWIKQYQSAPTSLETLIQHPIEIIDPEKRQFKQRELDFVGNEWSNANEFGKISRASGCHARAAISNDRAVGHYLFFLGDDRLLIPNIAIEKVDQQASSLIYEALLGSLPKELHTNKTPGQGKKHRAQIILEVDALNRPLIEELEKSGYQPLATITEGDGRTKYAMSWMRNGINAERESSLVTATQTGAYRAEFRSIYQAAAKCGFYTSEAIFQAIITEQMQPIYGISNGSNTLTITPSNETNKFVITSNEGVHAVVWNKGLDTLAGIVAEVATRKNLRIPMEGSSGPPVEQVMSNLGLLGDIAEELRSRGQYPS